MTFWDGHVQIPSKNNLDERFFTTWATRLVVLLGKKRLGITNMGYFAELIIIPGLNDIQYIDITNIIYRKF